MISRLFLFTGCFILHAIASGQDLSFYKESITMRIAPPSFYVTGIYYLKSSGEGTHVLIYPFPVDSLYGEADSLLIFDITNNRQISPMKQNRHTAVFKFDDGGRKEVVLQISYRQKLLASSAEYILKTTATWQKSLEQADYQLIIPPGMVIRRFSIPPGDSIDSEKGKVFYWSKKNYMPAENMVFDFAP